MTDGTTTPGVGSLAADPAYAQFDAETQGMFKNKGWDAKTPAEAAHEAAKSYREAERYLGVPQDQIVLLPKDAADAAGWKQSCVFIRMRPKQPDGKLTMIVLVYPPTRRVTTSRM